jgi:AcrR family transcriptional regulator
MEDTHALAAKPDGRRARGDRTRSAVLTHALEIARVEGLEALSFGRVALAAGVPKSTLQSLFGEREAFQAQVLEFGAADFEDGVRRRIPENVTPFGRLEALCEAWFALVGGGEAPGGCLITAAAAEFRTRQGPIAELVARYRERWRGALLEAANAAQSHGELDASADVDQLVFEILAIQGAANLTAGRPDNPDFERARRAVHQALRRAMAPKRRAD